MLNSVVEIYLTKESFLKNATSDQTTNLQTVLSQWGTSKKMADPGTGVIYFDPSEIQTQGK